MSNTIKTILQDPKNLVKIRNETGLLLSFYSRLDENALSILSYSPGDKMKYHVDGNKYYGKRWVGILTIKKGSKKSLCYKVGKRELCPDLKENTLILFQGDQIQHSVFTQDKERIVACILFCDMCFPRLSLFEYIRYDIINHLFY